MALRQRVLGFVLMLCSVAIPLHAAPLVVGGTDWRPFTWHDEQGELHGMSIDIAQQVMKLAHIDAHFVSYPVNRLQAMLAKGEIDINFADSPGWNSDEDKARFVFSKPYMAVQEHLYFLRDHPARYDAPNKLNNLTIGMVRGYTYPLLDEHFDDGQLKRLETSQDIVLLTLLQTRRADAVAMVDDLFDYLVAHNAMDARQFVRGPLLSESPLVFKLQASHADLLPAINAAIDKLGEGGVLASIRQSYLPAGRNLAGQ